MKRTIMTVIFLCAGAFAAGTSTVALTGYPVNISYVKEMSYIPEVDGWEKCSAADYAADSQKVAAQWDSIRVWVRQQYTAATVRALSGWAKKQMAAYKKTPQLKGLKFSAVRARPDHKKVVFQAVADTLPTHSPTVTRYLKIFLMYDSAEGRIVGVTLTIRGELLE
jgi:hypothetical protein